MLIPATAGKGSTWLSHGTLPKSSVPVKTVIQVTVFLQDMLVWVKMFFFSSWPGVACPRGVPTRLDSALGAGRAVGWVQGRVVQTPPGFTFSRLVSISG